MENIFSQEMILERAGTLDFKKSHDEEILKNLNRQKINLTTELKIGYIRKERGKYPKIQKILEEMLDEIYNFKDKNRQYFYKIKRHFLCFTWNIMWHDNFKSVIIAIVLW